MILEISLFSPSQDSSGHSSGTWLGTVVSLGPRAHLCHKSLSSSSTPPPPAILGEGCVLLTAHAATPGCGVGVKSVRGRGRGRGECRDTSARVRTRPQMSQPAPGSTQPAGGAAAPHTRSGTIGLLSGCLLPTPSFFTGPWWMQNIFGACWLR